MIKITVAFIKIKITTYRLYEDKRKRNVVALMT